jgi:hypothetical protein
MLRGQDVPQGITQIIIKIKELREAPKNFKSPFIIDLDEPLPVAGRAALAINITNLKALATLLGLDNSTCTVEAIQAACRGRSFPLYIAMVNDPQKQKLVRSLFFQA